VVLFKRKIRINEAEFRPLRRTQLNLSEYTNQENSKVLGVCSRFSCRLEDVAVSCVFRDRKIFLNALRKFGKRHAYTKGFSAEENKTKMNCRSLKTWMLVQLQDEQRFMM